MLDKLFFIILILNATGLFRFLAPQFKANIGVVSLVLLVFQIAYLITHINYLNILLRFKYVLALFILLLVWPLVTILYSPTLDTRQIGIQLYYISLFYSVVIYIWTNGLKSIHRVLTLSLVVTIFGLVLSIILPTYFEFVASISGARIEYNERAFGFFLQPNQAATALNLLFMGWFSLWNRKGTMWEPLVLTAYLGIMLLTGSRSGTVGACLIVGIILVHALWRDFRYRTTSLRMYVRTLLIIIFIIVGIACIENYLASRYYKQGSLLDRISLLTDFQITSGNIRDDISLRNRMAAQSIYWSLIRDKMIFGHGFGAEAYYMDNGPLFKTAHSSLLTFWMEYGLFYPIAFLLLFLRLYQNRRRRYIEQFVLKNNAIFQFVFFTALFFTINGGLINLRLFYIVWGLFFAILCNSNRILNPRDGQREQSYQNH